MAGNQRTLSELGKGNHQYCQLPDLTVDSLTARLDNSVRLVQMRLRRMPALAFAVYQLLGTERSKHPIQ